MINHHDIKLEQNSETATINTSSKKIELLFHPAQYHTNKKEYFNDF